MNRYIVITPARNEGEFLHSLIDSIVKQTVRPQQWIIVDDGSADNSCVIALADEKQHHWISVVRRTDRGLRNPGAGVVEAFSDGLARVKSSDWDYLVKLDADLSFESVYFERCLGRFKNDLKLGIGGGTICQKMGEVLVTEAPGDPVFHVRGATKIYRRQCWESIGGLLPAPGWDTIDEYKANMLGWTTYTFPEMKVWHHRKAGAAHGTWKNWVKNGLANYVAGYHPLFMGFKCGKRAFSKPYGIGALGLLVGFLGGYLRRVPQVDDSDLIRYVRSQQLKRLSFQRSLWSHKLV